EIDIEILGRYDNDIQFNPITPGQLNHVSHYQSPFNPASDYHTYGFEWTPQYVAWFVDGKEVHRQTGAHIEALNLPQKIMMNIWNPVYESWVGSWNDNVLPAFAYYDWVRYSAYTPGNGDYGTGNNFKTEWHDDFNSWDTTRWSKATHTFNGNNCDFVHANAVFQDGKLVLCLTKESSVGYTDIAGPAVKYARAEANGVEIRFTEELDPVSAENPASYINSAHPVIAAKLLKDSQTVFLTLTNYHKDSVSNVVVNNVKDRSAAMNSSGVKNAVLIKSNPLTFPVKVNCGGGAFQDFIAEKEWGPNAEYGRMDGNLYANNGTAAGTSNPEIYKTEVNGLVRYRFRVPNGTYSVTLMMAENFFTTAGKRIFSVSIQGEQIVNELDLYATAGKGVQVNRIFNEVKVTDGLLEVHFSAQVDNPLVNGIMIVPAAAGINENSGTVPERSAIGQNYPNPFNGETVIPVQTAQDDHITVRIFDSLGRNISVIPVGDISKGHYSITWNSRDDAGRTVASGIYYYMVEGRHLQSVKKMLLLR
ncbi:MAG: family 16 glycosylhydrolase, partial [Bacteroidetes bacterium]|nr:family 16 glycosylhydrolase [Bacteroidota bacterium]